MSAVYCWGSFKYQHTSFQDCSYPQLTLLLSQRFVQFKLLETHIQDNKLEEIALPKIICPMSGCAVLLKKNVYSGISRMLCCKGLIHTMYILKEDILQVQNTAATTFTGRWHALPFLCLSFGFFHSLR